MNTKFIVSAFVLFVAFAIFYTHFSDRVLNTPPSNNPKNYINSSLFGNKKVMVTLGDSITHGVGSADYSKLISNEMKQYEYHTINAGMNADLAITALRKIDNVIACKPEIVTILLGTNDVLASEGIKETKAYVKMKRIEKNDTISPDSFAENLRKIVSKLKDSGVKHIFLLSLPLMGEDLSQEINQKVFKYSEIIKNISDQENVNYVPLNEVMREAIQKNIEKTGFSKGFSKDNKIKNRILLARHYFLRESLDILFESYGYRFLTDGVHLNSTGAELVKLLIIEEIKEQGLLVR